MDGDSKQRNQRNRRRERAVRMQKQKQAAQGRDRGDPGSGENDDSPARQKPQRPPTRKKRSKEPIFEEDIVDGFAILSFRTYEDLENTIRNFERSNRKSSPEPLLNSTQKDHENLTNSMKHKNNANHNIQKSLMNKLNHSVNNSSNTNNNNNSNNTTNNNNNSSNNNTTNDTSINSDDNSRITEELNGPPRSLSRDQLSDVSSHSSSGRGYMCDSESDDDRVSDTGSDLFSCTPVKSLPSNNTRSSPSATNNQNSSSPLPRFSPLPVQNGPRPRESASPISVPVCHIPPPAPPPPPPPPPPPVLASPPVSLPASSPVSTSTPSSSSAPSLPTSHRATNGTSVIHPSAPHLPQPRGEVLRSSPVVIPPPPHLTASSSGPVPLPHSLCPTLPVQVGLTTATSAATTTTTTVASVNNSSHNNSCTVVTNSSSSTVCREGPHVNSRTASHPIPFSNGTSCGSVGNLIPNNHSVSSPPSLLSSHLSHGRSSSIAVNNGGSNSSTSSSSNNGSNLLSAITHSSKPGSGLNSASSSRGGQPPPPLYPFQLSNPHRSSPPFLSSCVPVLPSHPALPTAASTHPSSTVTTAAPAAIVSPSSVVGHITNPAARICTPPVVTCSPSLSNTSLLRTCSPAAATTPQRTTPTTPTLPLQRDSHSARSSSSLSSLSQLSQSLHSGKEIGREGASSAGVLGSGSSSSSGSNRSRSSSRNNTPSVCSASIGSLTGGITTPCCTYSTTTYGGSSGLTSLVFSKAHPWVSSSANPILSTTAGPHLTPPLPPRPTPPSPNPSGLPLPPSLHNSHHTSPFASHPAAAAPPSLHPSAPHPGMFAPPIPPPVSLSSSLNVGATSGPSHFVGESLFSQPISNVRVSSCVQPDQDLLRRELDTRFLASQDRSINIPPPPYMRADMHQHQHQHTHMHQHSPFLPPPLGGSLVPQPSTHLFDKFPKVDAASYYGRNALGIPSYPTLSPLLTPGASGATTPFGPPGHLAAFQPKMNSLVKNKNMKSGRWCAMHVRIAWEIYHHQQKQQQAEGHKTGSSSSVSKTPADILRPPLNHLFPSLPSFSPSLLGATSAPAHQRMPFEASPHHNSFLGTNPSHLGVSPFVRGAYPGFGPLGSNFGGLGSLAGLSGAAGVFGNRDLGTSCLSSLGNAAQDHWNRLHRTPPSFQSNAAASASSAAAWGGLKAEAERERERMQKEEHEREEKRKAQLEKERKEKELQEKNRAELEKLEREKREQERQKERERENHRFFPHLNTPEGLRNGELMDRAREREREWERLRDRRDTSRSPIRNSSTMKNDSAFDATKHEIKVKEEKRDDDSVIRESLHAEKRPRPDAYPQRPSDSLGDYLSRNSASSTATGVPPTSSSSLGVPLTPLDRARMMVPFGLAPHPPGHVTDRPSHSQMAAFWGSLPPTTSASGSTNDLRDPYRTLDYHHPHLERELQRYGMASHERAENERHQMQLERERHQAYERSKLAPPPLRPTDPANFMPPGPLPPPPPTHPPSLFPTLAGANPYLNSLNSSGGRSKSGSPGNPVSGVPPPLIPCTGGATMQNHSQGASPALHHAHHHKLGPHTLVENSHESFYAAKERRELGGSHPSEIDAQSR